MLPQNIALPDCCYEIYRHIPVPTYVWRVAGGQIRLVDYNQAAFDLSGPDLSRLIGLNAENVYPDMPHVIAAMTRCRDLKEPVAREVEMPLRTTGQLKNLHFVWLWIDPDILLQHARDLTEIKNSNRHIEERVAERTTQLRDANDQLSAAFASLQQKENFLSQVLDSIQAGISILDLDFNVLRVNKTMEEWYGLTPGFSGGKCYKVFQRDRDDICSVCPAKKTIEEKTPAMELIHAFRRDGSQCWFEVYTFPLIDDAGKMIGVIEFLRDVTVRVEVERSLTESEEKYRTLLNNQNDAVFLHEFRPEGFACFAEVNDMATKRYGYSREEFRYIGASDISLPDDVRTHGGADARRNLLNRKQQIIEAVHIKKTGERFPVEINSTVVELQGKKYILSTARDISERKAAEMKHRELEERLRQKYKMEAIGLMAGGIAHNFNNNLAIILGNVELAKLKSDKCSGIHEYLDKAHISVLRSRDLITQILTYSRKTKQTRENIRLSEIVRETFSLLESTIPSSIKMEYHIDSGCSDLLIEADAGQVQEALINLCTNAVYAMGEKGLLTIFLAAVELSPDDFPAHDRRSAGFFARLSVRDSGCGMSAAIMEKIFDPFFTTKDDDHGTGMGLSSVQGIMEQHDGLIKVESTPGTGTVFDLYFPLAQNKGRQPHLIDENLPRGTERILFIDDDEMLVQVGAGILSESGYQLTTLTSSLEGWELLQRDPEGFDLVVTDQKMPELSGLELAERVQQLRPQLPVIICSGWLKGADNDHPGVAAYCMKPVEMPELLKTVRAVLDTAAAEKRR